MLRSRLLPSAAAVVRGLAAIQLAARGERVITRAHLAVEGGLLA
jgi:hypothetical protein